MRKNPLKWSVQDVSAWLGYINCRNARDIFLHHGIEGKDLLSLTDADLRFDLKFKRLHDRKYMLRMIAELKSSLIAVIEVLHQSQACRVRVSDPTAYTFDHLRCDVTRFWGLDEDEYVLQDSQGLLWGSVPSSCLFDSDLKQQEVVFLASIRSEPQLLDEVSPKAETLEVDEEDFNEDNPHHIAASASQSRFLDESKVSSRPFSPLTSMSHHSFTSHPSHIQSRIMNVNTGFDRLQDASQRAEAEAARNLPYGKA